MGAVGAMPGAQFSELMSKYRCNISRVNGDNSLLSANSQSPLPQLGAKVMPRVCEEVRELPYWVSGSSVIVTNT